MNRILKVDPIFKPCPVDNHDELFNNGIFVFNISKMIDFIENNPDQIERIEIATDDYTSFSTINEEHLESVDISRPVILAEIAPGRFNLIDGHHRLEKARRLGVQTLPAFRLTCEQHIRFLTDKNAYHAYVGYWNEKLDSLM
jgi:hypothetical protein